MTLLLLTMGLLLLVTLNPLGMADGPGGDALGSAGDGGESGGETSGQGEAPPAYDLEADVRSALQGESETGGPATPRIAAPPEPSPLDTPAPQAGEPGSVFQKLGFDEQSLAGLPPEAQQPLAAFLEQWYAEKYVPVATAVRDNAEQQAAWYEQLNQFYQTPAFAMAEQLAADPALLARVQSVISGTGQAPDPAGEGLDLESLDPETRAIYARMETATSRVQAENEQLRSQLEELRGWMQTSEQRSAEQHRQQAAVVAGKMIDGATGAIAQALGFDPREYGQQWEQTLQLANQMIAGQLYAWEAAGRRGPRPQPNLETVLKQAMRAGGFDSIVAQRRRASASRADPPPYEAGEAGGYDLQADVRRALSRT